MLNYFKSKREHKIRRTYTFDPKVIEELDNYCDENSINKSNMFNNSKDTQCNLLTFETTYKKDFCIVH